MFHVEHFYRNSAKIILVQDGHLMYIVHNTLDMMAVIVWDNCFNIFLLAKSNPDN